LPTDLARLPARGCVPVDGGSPSGQTHETQCSRAKPRNESFDAGQSVRELDSLELVCSTSRSFDEVGHSDSMGSEQCVRITVDLGQSCAEQRWPEPVAGPSEGDS
jgi:hypothetical protein